ncbi:MAG: ATP-grasp domain-containing protein [Mycoplasmataceae bacterium]|nr:ATP-grasp domain-containing protein [Mycoplasmataceae bacterium]
MITTDNKKKAVVLVDPISTPRRLIPIIHDKGLTPIVVFTNYSLHPENEVYELSSLIDETIQDMTNEFGEYAVFINEPMEFSELFTTLSQYEVKAVIKGSDGGVRLGEQIAQAFKLPSNAENFFDWAMDKNAVNQKLAEKKVRSIKTVICNRNDSVSSIISKIGGIFPLFVKPSLGAGGANSYTIYTENNLTRVLEEIFSLKAGDKYLYDELLVQELIDGEEYVVNTYSENGIHYVSDVWKYVKAVTKTGAFIYRNTILLKGKSVVKEDCVKYAIDVLNALGFKEGPCHMEIKVDTKGPVLIECNWRTMGGSQFYDKPVCLGLSQNELYLTTALDNKWLYTNARNKLAEYEYYCECLDVMPQVYGTVKKINIPHLLKKLKSFHTDVIFIKEGHKVIPAQSIDDDLGNLQFMSKDYETIKKDTELFTEIEDNYLELFFEFEETKDHELNLQPTSVQEYEVFKDFTNKEKVAVITDEPDKFADYEIIDDFHHAQHLKCKYILVDVKSVSKDITECYDFIDDIEKIVDQDTTIVFSNKTLNAAPYGFEYLLCLNNLTPIIPSDSRLVSGFSFWFKD